MTQGKQFLGSMRWLNGGVGQGMAEIRMGLKIEPGPPNRPQYTQRLSGSPFSWIGATPCEDMESQLQALLMKKASLEKALEDISAALPKVKAAWDYCYSQKVQQTCASLTEQPLQDCLNAAIAACNATNNYEYVKQQEAGIKADLQSLEGQIVEMKAKIKNCPSGGGGGGGGPECSPTKPCPEGKECCQQGWTWCTPGTCASTCPEGYTRGADGFCKAVAAGGKKSSSGLGLLLLGLGAAGAFFVAIKPPTLPPRAADRLNENRSKKRSRR